MNSWFLEDDIMGGRVFPVNSAIVPQDLHPVESNLSHQYDESLSLPPLWILKESVSIYVGTNNVRTNIGQCCSIIQVKQKDIAYYFTSNKWNWIKIVLPTDAVITQLQFIVWWSCEVRNPEVIFNQSLHMGLMGILKILAENPLNVMKLSVTKWTNMEFPELEKLFVTPYNRLSTGSLFLLSNFDIDGDWRFGPS